MSHFRRLASVLALATVSAVSLPGCIIGDCEDGQENCIQLESGTFYTDTDSSTLDYSAGQDLIINGFNGSIDVVTGGPSGQVEITTERVTLEESDAEGEARAKIELEEDINIDMSSQGSAVTINTSKNTGNGNLAVRLTVRLPAEFDGRVDVTQGNGSVDIDLGSLAVNGVRVFNDGAGDINVSGARGALDIVGDFDVNVGVAEWPTQNGTVISNGGTGDVVVTVPAGANGSILATAVEDADGETLNGPNPLPADWTEDRTGASATYTFGDGSGGRVDVTATGTLGSVTIEAR